MDVKKRAYLAPAAIVAIFILVSPAAAGQAAAYGVLAFAGYKAVKFFLGRGGRKAI
ncbi:MAG: hypothetical protein QXD77_00450 [Candidatus Aenigmatarchaeota archaeon]